ncbi:MAG: glycosyltransferase family 1 protein [Candidatus Buchananbacteria bacterium]|nr:glycosyltransferase family 1 protein [Candidatus Buchananbacteria bacterium]
MKIGIDVRCLMVDNYSGISWYAFNLLKSIFELDKENEYILFYNSSRKVNLPRFDHQNVRSAGFSHSNKIFNLSLLLADKPKIDKIIGGVDVFFMPNINFSALSNDCRKIITVHDLSYLRYPQFWTLKSRFWHQVLTAKRIIQEADAVIAVSENTKQDLIDLLSINPEKIKVIYEGVDQKFQIITNQVELDRVQKKYKLPGKFILYLGTLEPRKNIESLIEAFSKLKTDHYLVIGGGVGWKAKRIIKLAKASNKIKIIGYVDEIDKRGLYNLADLFVYPSYYEGFGLPLVEAMACGVPVIGGSNSSQVEVVSGAGLLVDPYNINDIVKAMEFILGDQVLREKLVRSGLDNIKKYNWQQTAKETLELFLGQ